MLAVVDDDERFLIGDDVFFGIVDLVFVLVRLVEPLLLRCDGCFETGTACREMIAEECGAAHGFEVVAVWV